MSFEKEYRVIEWDVIDGNQKYHFFKKPVDIKIRINYEKRDNGQTRESCFLYFEDSLTFKHNGVQKIHFVLPLIFNVQKDSNNYWVKINGKDDFDVRTYEVLNGMNYEELETSIRGNLNNGRHFSADEWEEICVDSYGEYVEETRKHYPKYRPYSLIFSDRVVFGESDSDENKFDIGIIFKNEQFDVRLICRIELCYGSTDYDLRHHKGDVFDSLPEELFWKKHCILTITNTKTKQVKKYMYKKERYLSNDEKL